MQVIVSAIERFCAWSGLQVNVSKSEISAFDHGTGRPMCTDGIKFQGLSFTALAPASPFKYLGVRITMIGDFRCEKEHVLHETANRLQALSKASFLLPTQKELVIKAGIVPVFRYSAGLVPWSLPELENITALWVRAYRIAWRMPDGTDSGLFRLPPRGGGRGCPSATQIWLADALQLLDHCDRIPGEVRTVVRQATLHECKAHGCLDLFQLQRAMRRCPHLARTVLELLVCRLDEHGLDAVPAHRPPQLGTDH
mmetsp:Transcript_17308/g.47654  ORF Transcript_17308/g.47654 Transcript_17308/m.47654 type:complete len:254 (-) Transcript_17308:604-1365(-)